MAEYRKPIPKPTPETQDFWDGTKAGELRLQRCNECSHVYFPPRPFCSKCASRNVSSFKASGKGTLHTFTVIHYPQFPGYEFPIIAALVDLEEGTRLMSSLVGCQPARVQIGMKLVGEIQRDEDGFALPVFRPAQ